ncbi:hypothetical protein HYW42_03910 [Candidatus Daviesbacteria bacterium]|nr:hypothetical protein [Candidatus Daviesbacteria bacterium]
MPKLDQKGAVPPLAIAIIAVIVIGVIYFISQNSNNSQKNTQTQESKQDNTDTPKPTTQWKTYKNEERGYSIKHPEGWTVENSSGQNSRIIKVTASDKTAFVIIEAIGGSRLAAGETEKVAQLMEEKLKKDTNIKVASSNIKTEGDTSGYLAEGEYLDEGKEPPTEKKILFEERFKVAENGRGMRLHRAYTQITKEINQPITSEIIKSFSIN